VYDLMANAAQSDAPVIIYGESGTGKELVAKAIHKLSGRMDKPYIKVNCAALTESLLESELFGHEKGSFTGAVAAKPGLFEIADGGALFIDEFGEMTGGLQAKLLRVLEDRKITRLGSNDEVEVNVRLVAATNADLKEMVETKQFRKDLFYRLSVVNIQLTPLRERPGDIPLLMDHFQKEFSERNRKEVRGFSRTARQALMTYDWPGNIRQLENRIKKAIVLADKTLIGPDDLDLGGNQQRAVIPLTQAREDFTRSYILEVLERNGGNRTRTARDLGVDPRTVFRYLEREPDAPEPGRPAEG